MDKKYGNYDKKRAWAGVRINYDNEATNVGSDEDNDVDNINENDL
jgi:hypothetical protein